MEKNVHRLMLMKAEQASDVPAYTTVIRLGFAVQIAEDLLKEQKK